MVVLGEVEFGGREDLCPDFSFKPGGLPISTIIGDSFLFLIVEK